MAAKRCLPGIAKWDTYGGGTSCPDNVRNYGITASKGNYKVSCITSQYGRMLGYTATFENVKGLAKNPGLHQWLTPDGMPGYGSRYRSPAAAAAAANKHCLLMEQGLAGARGRRRRRRR